MRFPVALALLAGVLVAQTPRDLTGYLPAGTPVVVDLVDAAACVRKGLGLLDPLPPGLPPAARLALLGLPLLTKAATGMDPTDLLEVVAPSQVAFALYPAARPFPVLLTRIAEEAEVLRVLRRVNRDGKVHAAVAGGVLIVTDSAAHLRTVRRFPASGRPALLADAGYRGGRAPTLPGRGLRFYVDVAAVRKLGRAGSIWQSLDAGGRVLFGPLLRPLDLATRIDGQLEFSAAGLALRGRADASLGGDPLRVDRLMVATTAGREVPAPPPATLGTLSLDRDLGAVLREPGAWLGEDGVLRVQGFLAVADQILGGGTTLVGDLLPNIRMPLDLFVTATTSGADGDSPRIRLPAFTLVFGLGADAAAAEKLLVRALGTFTAIANAQRVRDRKTGIVMRSERRDGYRFSRVRFADWNGPGDPPTEQGLSPTLLFAHGHGILSTTIDGAIRMAKTLRQGRTVTVHGDAWSLQGGPIAAWMAANARVLEIDRVLKEGGTRREAAMFFRSLREVLRLLEFRGRIEPQVTGTRFSFELVRVTPAGAK